MFDANFRTELFLHWSFQFDYQSKVKIRKFNLNNNQSTTLTVLGFTLESWMKHLSSVFIQNKHVRLVFGSGSTMSLEYFYEYIKYFRISVLLIPSSKIQNHQLPKLLPSLECLTVLDDGPIPESVLIQNFELLDSISIDVALHDTLLSNCSQFKTHASFTDQQLNLLMKHWIKGLNPSLRYFKCFCHGRGQDRTIGPILFKGVNYTEKGGEGQKNLKLRDTME